MLIISPFLFMWLLYSSLNFPIQNYVLLRYYLLYAKIFLLLLVILLVNSFYFLHTNRCFTIFICQNWFLWISICHLPFFHFWLRVTTVFSFSRFFLTSTIQYILLILLNIFSLFVSGNIGQSIFYFLFFFVRFFTIKTYLPSFDIFLIWLFLSLAIFVITSFPTIFCLWFTVITYW